MLHKKFIVIEGIDGCGKGTVMNAIIDFLKRNKIRFLDLRERKEDLASSSGLTKECSAILTCEPTHHGTGRELREKILRNLENYTARQVAEKFTEDRNILYEKTVIPALKKGMVVFQDRSVISTFVYQVNEAVKNNEKFSTGDIEKMNAVAMENPPGLVIVQNVSPEAAHSRLSKRKEKQDNTEFEKIEFLKRNSEGYRKGEWRRLFAEKGTDIKDLDCNAGIDAVKQNAVKIIEDYLGKNGISLVR